MKQSPRGVHIIKALVISSLVSVLLYLISAIYYGASPFWFLNWNLILAWLPLIFAIVLVDYLKRNAWSSWPGVVLTLLWLGFLPNSFYLITDFIHLDFAAPSQSLYYVIMLFSFSFNGLIVGFLSLYLLHRELLKRLKVWKAHSWITAILLLCSFAIYLGRYLRWSTWDVILNPAGILFDVSDRIINPVAYGQTFQVTSLFFVMLVGMYFALWQLAQTVSQDKIR